MRTRPEPLRRKLLLPAVLVASGAAVLAGVGHQHLWPKNFGAVDEGKIYRSGQLTPGAFEDVVRTHGIRTIIDLGSYEPHERGERRNRQASEAMGATRYLFDLEGDATGNPNEYVQVLRLMLDPANQPVLVHCGAGAERTSCAMSLYNTMMHGATLDDGIQEAKRYRHSPRRNPHLREVLERHGSEIIRAVREGGYIEGHPVPPEPTPTRTPT